MGRPFFPRRARARLGDLGLRERGLVARALLLFMSLASATMLGATARAPSLAARSLCAARAPRSLSLSLYSSGRHLRKSLPCPLWSSSFSFCLARIARSTSTPSAGFSSSAPLPPMAAAAPVASAPAPAASEGGLHGNPLLQDFAFPPFDVVQAKHVVPGIRELLRRLVRSLDPSLSLALLPFPFVWCPDECLFLYGRGSPRRVFGRRETWKRWSRR